ncbi:hypothetical protein RCL1_005669 [Eukaryota sp. TZLM3-RCL]
MKNVLVALQIRFPDSWQSLISTSGLHCFSELKSLIAALPCAQWSQLFPVSVDNNIVSCRNLNNLGLTIYKLQKRLTVLKEAVILSNTLNVASESSNVQLVAMLKDVGSCDGVTSSSSCLITQRPKQFGLSLSDDEWILAMKMRLNIPCFAATSASKCNCGETATLHHVLNCKNLRVYRTLIHDSVKHSLRNFVSAHGVPVLLEQTFKQLHPKMSSADKMYLVTSSVGGIELLVDVTSVDTCSHSSCNLSPVASLSNAELRKHTRYDSRVALLNSF